MTALVPLVQHTVRTAMAGEFGLRGLATVAQGAAQCCTGQKQYPNIKSISMINIHFFSETIYFLARIDQQVKSYHSRSSKQYSNIKSVSIIKRHLFLTKLYDFYQGLISKPKTFILAHQNRFLT